MPKWEYQFVGFTLDKKTEDISEHALNREGENGWEIVAIIDGSQHGPSWHVALMKRLKR